MFVERREVVTRYDVRELTDSQLHEQVAQAVESMGEPEFAAKVRRMGQS
jgi:hypothetical protein